MILHETGAGVVSSIINGLNKGADIARSLTGKTDRALRGSNKAYYSSISKAAKNLILEFPVMCTNTIDINTACMISKAIERNSITLLQLLFSANSMTASDAFELIDHFHSNLKSNYNLDDFISVADSFAARHEVAVNLDRKAYEAIKEDMKHIFDVLPDSINESSLMDYKIRGGNFGDIMVMKEARSDDEMYGDIRNFTQNPDSPIDGWVPYGSYDNNGKPVWGQPNGTYASGLGYDDFQNIAREIRDNERHRADMDNMNRRAERDARADMRDDERLGFDRNEEQRRAANHRWMGAKHAREEEKHRMDMSQSAEKHQWARNAEDRAAADFAWKDADRERQLYGDTLKNIKTRTDITKNYMDMQRNFLLDTDVKKANEMAPSLMIARFVDPNSNFQVEQSFVIGVKARLIPISSADIMDRVSAKNADNQGFLKLMRATTREISFAKDFLLGINQAKVDAIAYSRKGSSNPMWKVLEKRAIKSKWNKLIKNTKAGADCIATLVVSDIEADEIRKQSNMNIKNLNVAAKLMDAYALYCLVIVDEVSESISFLYDGNDNFETLSFSNLERENGGNKDYKKIVNLLAKNAR